MPRVTVVTPMRDAAGVLYPYTERIDALDYPIADLRLVFVEGDSVDGTAGMLELLWGDDPRVTMVTCHTGSRKYGSVVDPDRFRVLATVFNAGLDAVDLEWSEYVLLLPVDIQFGPELVSRLVAWKVDAVSPLAWMRNLFYDFWALSRDGHFYPPFSRESAVDLFNEQLTEMTTIGGTMLIDVRVLRAGVRYGEQEVDRDFSRAARAAGFRLWLDPTTHVEHSPI